MPPSAGVGRRQASPCTLGGSLTHCGGCTQGLWSAAACMSVGSVRAGQPRVRIRNAVLQAQKRRWGLLRPALGGQRSGLLGLSHCEMHAPGSRREKTIVLIAPPGVCAGTGRLSGAEEPGPGPPANQEPAPTAEEEPGPRPSLPAPHPLGPQMGRVAVSPPQCSWTCPLGHDGCPGGYSSRTLGYGGPRPCRPPPGEHEACA